MSRGRKAERAGLHIGCDFRTDDGFERGKQMYATGNPDRVWTSSPCDPFCTFHNINVKRYPAFARRNRRRRQEGMVMCERALWFCEQQILRRKRFAFEWSRRSQGWSAVPAMGEFLARYQDVLFWADCAGCRVDCRCPWSHELLSKEWSILTNSRELANALNLVCTHNFKHRVVEGSITRSTAYYPRPFVRRAIDAILLPEAWNNLLLELEAISTDLHLEGYTRADEEFCCTDVNFASLEGPSTIILVAMPIKDLDSPTAKVIRQVDAWLHHFHRNAGHPSRRAMEVIIRRRKVHSLIMDRVKAFSCPTCAELKTTEPVPPAAHNLPEAPWLVVGSDLCEWKHPDDDRDEKARIFVAVDECTRVPVAAIWKIQRLKETANITAEELLDIFLRSFEAIPREPGAEQSSRTAWLK